MTTSLPIRQPLRRWPRFHRSMRVLTSSMSFIFGGIEKCMPTSGRANRDVREVRIEREEDCLGKWRRSRELAKMVKSSAHLHSSGRLR